MSMPKWIDPRITIGNIITVAVLLIGFFTWGAVLEARVNQIASDVADLKADGGATTTRMGNIEKDANALEKVLLPRLTRIETILERIEKKTTVP